jgi:hypothetical protein
MSSSDLTSNTVQEVKQLKERLDKLVQKLDEPVTRNWSESDYIYLSGPNCPPPYLECDEAAMLASGAECPGDKDAFQPPMYTSTGARCYKSPAVLKELLKAKPETSRGIMQLISELVRTAALANSKASGATVAGGAPAAQLEGGAASRAAFFGTQWV